VRARVQSVSAPSPPFSQHHRCPAQAQQGSRSSAKCFGPSLALGWAGLLDRTAVRWHAAPQAEVTLIDVSSLAPPPPVGNRRGIWNRRARAGPMTDPTSPRTSSAERSPTVDSGRERTRAATSSASSSACLGLHSKSSSTRQQSSWTKSTPHLCCLPRGGGAPPRPRRCHLCCRHSLAMGGVHDLWATTHAARAKTRLHPCVRGAAKWWQRSWQNHVCSWCCWWSCPPAGAVVSAVG